MKILVVTSRFPYPIERGDKLRAYYQLRELARRNEVVLIALSEGDVPVADRARVESLGVDVRVVTRTRVATVASVIWAALTGLPLQVGYFRSPGVQRDVRRIIDEVAPDHLYCQLTRTAWAAERVELRSTIDYQDAFSAAMARRAAGAAPGLSWLMALEARRIARYEARAFAVFDNHLIISEQDRDLLDVPDTSAVQVLANGVDTEFFRPAPTGDDGTRSEHREVEVAFVGNMGYPPNVRAAEFLANEVMTRIRRRRAGSGLLLAGARPARSVLRLAGPHVEVSGWLDDIRTAYSRSRIMVAPLVIGAGQQNKILEAMAMGVPCVTTELVNNAIGGVDGEHLFLAENADEFAERSLQLLETPDLHDRMASAARRFVEEKFSWSAVGERLEAALVKGPRG